MAIVKELLAHGAVANTPEDQVAILLLYLS